LTPFRVLEGRGRSLDELWLRGGFPESLLSSPQGLPVDLSQAEKAQYAYAT
jgi:hypothetical protein